MATADPELVMLYDGECAVCDRGVQTILRHDRAGTIRFAALQGEYAGAVKDRHPWLKPLDTVVVVDHPAGGPERVLTHSDAVLRLVRYLGGWWRVFLVVGLVPRPVRDWAYRLFARNRYRVFGKRDSCRLPTPAEKAQFIS